MLLTPVFNDIYPTTSYIGLVRHGIALYEGLIRRGWKAEEAAVMYKKVCSEMISYSEEMENFYLIRFEDLINTPSETLSSVHP